MATENEPGPGPLAGLLDTLDSPECESVQRAAVRQEVSSGEQIIAEGSALDRLLIVESGLFSVTIVDRRGRPLEMTRYGPGDFCGEMSFLSGERASASVTAVIDSTIWAIPYEALAGPAHSSPRLVSYLAGGLVQRLSATNERFRTLRSGRAVGVLASPGSPWSFEFLAHVGEAAARHAVRPVLLLDLEGSPTLENRVQGPSLSGHPPGAESLSWHDRVADEGEPHLVVVEGGEGPIDAAAVLRAVQQFQQRYGLVLVRLSRDASINAALVKELDSVIQLWEEGSEPNEIGSLASETILLRTSPQRGSPGELRALTRARRTPVIRVLPGGPSALSQERDAGEPWDTIDWTARHLLQRKVGLALGAGGSKGYAHIGVIEQLQTWGVPIDYVAGCSIGAPIAGAFAAGRDLHEVKAQIDAVSRRALKRTIPYSSLLNSGPLRAEIRRISAGKQFEELEIPLALVAVDIQRREEVVFAEGDLADAIVASFAIPAIYPAVERDGRALVDGALLNPVPVTTVADLGADIVIGVKLTNPVTQPKRARGRGGLFRPPPIVDTILQAFEVMQWQLATSGAAQADILIEPVFSGSTGLRDFDRGAEFMEVGRRATAGARREIERWLPWIGRSE